MNNRKVLLALSASLAASVAHSGLAHAQEGGQVRLNEIVVQSDGAEGEENTVDISQEDLSRSNPTDLQDVFTSEPTIEVGSPLPISQKLYVNGVEETNLSVTIDGARQNNKIFHHNATTYIDPALLKAINIYPGVAPADAGPGALGGAAQFETMDPSDLLKDGQVMGGFIVSEYDSSGDTVSGSLAGYASKDGFEVLGYGKVADGGIREDGDGVDIPGSSTNIVSLLGKLAYQSVDGHRFEVSYESVNDDALRPYRADSIVIVGRPVPPRRNYDLHRQNLVFTYTDEVPEGWWDPTVKLAYSVTDLAANAEDYENYGTTYSFNGKAENRFAFSKGSVVAGFDFYSERADLFYYSLPDTTFDTDQTFERASNVGVYAQGRFDVTDKLYTSLGARGDFHHFEGTSGYEEDNSGLSVNGSFEYQLTDVFSFGAGASSVWAGIPLAENFIMSSAWVYDGSVKPVDSTNYYIAGKADFGRYYVEGKVFRTNIDNARTPGDEPGVTSDMKSEGFEIGAGISWTGGFLKVGYANIDTEVNGITADSYSGRYLTTPIGQIITLEAVHSFADTGFTVGADARFALEHTDTYNFGFPAAPLPAFEVVNAFVEYVPPTHQQLTLRFEVNNIFDETYSSRGTYGQEFEGEVEPLREPGRSFKLTARGEF